MVYVDISTPEELASIDLNVNYRLTQDIDLSGYKNWTPIGGESIKYSGTFDGGNS